MSKGSRKKMKKRPLKDIKDDLGVGETRPQTERLGVKHWQCSSC